MGNMYLDGPLLSKGLSALRASLGIIPKSWVCLRREGLWLTDSVAGGFYYEKKTTRPGWSSRNFFYFQIGAEEGT
jgi:hypothetical protein